MYKRNHFVLLFLVLAFFVSGASALIYQVLWVKQLTLFFGNSTLAVSTILASFMGGLALGSYVMAQKAVKILRVVKAYGILEILIGVYAVFIPLLFNLTDVIYRYAWPLLNGNYSILILLRFILIFAVLIFPTAMMGATLPLLVKYYINKDDVIVKYISILYGVNTLGAVVGAFVCGFYLLEVFGIFQTNLFAVLLNLVAAILAFSLDKRQDYSTDKESIAEGPTIKTSLAELSRNFILWAMLISGFTAMVYEVVWTRQLVLVFGSTAYGYTSMLSIFLIGIALGSLCVNKFFKDNNKNIYYFAVFELLIGLLVIAGSYYYKDLFYYFNLLATTVDPSMFIFPIILISAVLILPVAFLFGVLFPLSIKLFTPVYQSISQRTGVIYSFNTLGCILGSFSAGFILIPLIGLKMSLVLCASINILIAGLFVYTQINNKNIKAFAIILAMFFIALIYLYPVEWKKEVLSYGVFVNKVNDKDLLDSYNDYYKVMEEKEVVYYKEGQHSTIAVTKYKKTDGTLGYSIFNNGKVDASTGFIDMRTQVMLAYFPLFMSKKIDDVLVVGMGSGITAGVLTKFPVKSIEMVELEKAVMDASQYFSSYYGDPRKDKRFKLIVDDARNYLRVTDKKYDLILSEPSNVWVSGVASLFTKEYYGIISNKLKPDGILCQWIHIYSISPEAIISVLEALDSSFNYVTVGHTKTSGDFVILASNRPIKADLNLIRDRLSNKRAKGDLKGLYNITNEYEFFNLFIADNESIGAFLAKIKNIIPTNTDDNSYLEFKATKDFFTSKANNFKFNTVKAFSAFKGVSKGFIQQPSDDIFKSISNAIFDQYIRSVSANSKQESFEYPLYKLQCLEYADKYSKEYPNKVDSIYLLGVMLYLNDQFTSSISKLEEAMSKGTYDNRSLIILSRYYNNYITGSEKAKKEKVNYDYKKGLSYALKAKELYPENPFVYFLCGISYYNLGQYGKAEEFFKQYYKKSQLSKEKVLDEFYKYYSISALK